MHKHVMRQIQGEQKSKQKLDVMLEKHVIGLYCTGSVLIWSKEWTFSVFQIKLVYTFHHFFHNHITSKRNQSPSKSSEAVIMPSLFLSKNSTCFWSAVILAISILASTFPPCIKTATTIHLWKEKLCNKFFSMPIVVPL